MLFTTYNNVWIITNLIKKLYLGDNFLIRIVGYYYIDKRPPWCVGRFDLSSQSYCSYELNLFIYRD